MRLGGASQWAWNASRYGLRTGTTPVAGATAVFQPGVEGAGGGGHVAHVESVLGGGWFIVSEMNFGLNGGGWGRIDWRYAYAAPGVSFIY
jgi:surface antigen